MTPTNSPQASNLLSDIQAARAALAHDVAESEATIETIRASLNTAIGQTDIALEGFVTELENAPQLPEVK